VRNDRYPLSPRVQLLKAILGQLRPKAKRYAPRTLQRPEGAERPQHCNPSLARR
jgi:hypothetical protein